MTERGSPTEESNTRNLREVDLDVEEEVEIREVYSREDNHPREVGRKNRPEIESRTSQSNSWDQITSSRA